MPAGSRADADARHSGINCLSDIQLNINQIMDCVEARLDARSLLAKHFSARMRSLDHYHHCLDTPVLHLYIRE